MSSPLDPGREKRGKPEHVEQIGDETLVKEGNEKTDQFGAKAKTDPAEIKLVRKLDMYILVSFPALLSIVQTLELAY